MVGNGGTAVTVVVCCLAWREQDMIGKSRNPRGGWPGTGRVTTAAPGHPLQTSRGGGKQWQ
jgi:hypothetical protein